MPEETSAPTFAPAAAPEPRRVDIVGARGEPLGYSFTIKDELPEQTEGEHRTRYLARCISGWTSFYVDGEKHPFSQDRAAALMQRFPHISAQVEQAVKKS